MQECKECGQSIKEICPRCGAREMPNKELSEYGRFTSRFNVCGECEYVLPRDVPKPGVSRVSVTIDGEEHVLKIERGD